MVGLILIFGLLAIAFIVVVPLAFIWAVVTLSKCNALRNRLDNYERLTKYLAKQVRELEKKVSFLETIPKIEPLADSFPEITPVEKKGPIAGSATDSVTSPITGLEPLVEQPQPSAEAMVSVPIIEKQPIAEEQPIVGEPVIIEEPVMEAAVVEENIVAENIEDEELRDKREEKTKKEASIPPSPPFAPTSATRPTSPVSSTPPAYIWDPKPKETPKPQRKPQPASSEAAQWSALELLIGRKVMLWVSMVLFVLVAAFFVKYAVDNHWITDGMKVAGIGLFGTLFLAAGKYFSLKKLRLFSQALTCAGVCIVFMAGYVSYGYFQIVPINYAPFMMSAIVIGGFLLSWHYLSRLIGVIAVFGGLAVPLLVQADADLYIPFFSYLVILNIGTVVLINLMHRAPIAFVAFFGTQIEFCWWHNHFYEPDKLAAVIVFQACMYLVYLIDTTIASMTPKQRANWDDAARAIVSPMFFASTLWFYFHDHEVYKTWLGTFAFAFAGFYAILAVLYTNHLKRLWSKETDAQYSHYWKAGPVAATVMSFAFVAVGIPLQFGGNWIALAWYAVACGLWVAAHRLENKPFYYLSIIFHCLGLGRFLFFDLPYRPKFHSEMLDACSLPALMIGGLLILSAALANFSIPKRRAEERGLNSLFALEGTVYIWFILSLECWRYFNIHNNIIWPADPHRLGFTGHASLAVLWAVLSGVILIVGMATRSQAIRITGLVGFVLVTVKIYLYQLFIRPNYSVIDQYAIAWNPWFASIGIPVLVMILFAIWQLRIKPTQNEDEKQAYLPLGMNGLLIFWIMISLECFFWVREYAGVAEYFRGMEVKPFVIAISSLSLLWSAFALILLLAGIVFRSLSIRIFGIVVLAVLSVKIYALEIAFRPDYESPLLNPYFVSICVPAVLMMLFGIYFTRIARNISQDEKQAHLILGLNGLVMFWIAASVECFAFFQISEWGPAMFIARHSLCIFWTFMATLLLVIGIRARSQILRIFGACGFAAVSLVVYVFQIWDRPAEYRTVLLNPYFIPIAVAVLAMLVFSVWMTRIRPARDKEERLGFLILGLNALFMIWYALSVECFEYFGVRLDLPFGKFVAHSSLSILWTVLAVAVFVTGLATKSTALRIASLVGFAAIFLKILFLELFQRPEFATAVWNPYFMTIFVAVSMMMLVAVWAIRVQPVENKTEKYYLTAMGLAALLVLWGAMSFECFGYFDIRFGGFSAHASLTVFWTVLAFVLARIALKVQSAPLRWTAFALLLIAFFKVMPYELAKRPDSLLPFFNPFSLSTLLLSGTVIFICVMTLQALPAHHKVERHLIRIFGFGGLGLLWVCSSLECHESMLKMISQTGDDSKMEAARQAQMALSILWSLFGGVMIAVGFIWRSPTLRWMAILLFGLTTMKILLVDLQGLDQLYRIGAFFALAVVLFLAAWAYQKFKPEKR